MVGVHGYGSDDYYAYKSVVVLQKSESKTIKIHANLDNTIYFHASSSGISCEQGGHHMKPRLRLLEIQRGIISLNLQTMQTVIHLRFQSLSGNTTAQYNLGTLYATGRGTEQNFLHAAYWFYRAAIGGDTQAEKLTMKCLMDYVHKDFAKKTPQALYQEMLHFAEQLYPRENSRDIAVDRMNDLADFHMSRREYSADAKLFRAAAEYGDSGKAQNMLAVLYNTGNGVKQNDLVALYWFDRAVDRENRIGPYRSGWDI